MSADIDDQARVVRPRRSVLYMPSSNERALEKAKTIPCDALILDLEDAVAPDAKEQARANAVAAARSGAYGHREVTIRCNGLDTPWGADDLAAAAGSGASAVVIPKVASPGELDEVAGQLDAAGAPPELSIWAMVETPTALLDVRSIAHHPRVAVLVMGTNDLVKELRLGTPSDRAPLVPHLATALLGAREAGKVILDGVYNDVRDPDGFLVEARQGRDLGFDGKTLIHPSQLDTANRVFAPSPHDVEHAQAVIEAFADPQNAGKGVLKVNGKMTELLHLDEARRTVTMDEAIRAFES